MKTMISRIWQIAVCLLLAGAVGCGESQADLFAKHANRARDPGGDDERGVEKNANVSGVVAKQASLTPKSEDQVAGNVAVVKELLVPVRSGGAVDLDALSKEIGILPVSQRKPESELSVSQRRRRSYTNIKKINDALMSYVDHQGHYPKTYLSAGGSIPTLSWRVELLPYLGYNALYQKFDKARPWDMSPNKELLPFIPDEYISPERFDEKTNYLVPSGSAFMFAEGGGFRPGQIDDGIENTIMLLEVNDPLAVAWTEPKDFAPKAIMRMDPYLHKLRSDGTFALWASGFPTLLSKDIPGNVLFQIMSYEKADGPNASEIHQPISIEEVDDYAEAEMEESLDAGADASIDMLAGSSLENTGQPTRAMAPVPVELNIKREPVPSSTQLTVAQKKLRGVYRDQIVAAKTSRDKSALANDLLDTARTLDADLTGAYVLQQAALKLSIEAADAAVLVRGIDQRVARFDIDSFSENVKWIQEFSEATAKRRGTSVNGTPLIARCIPTIYAGIRKDEYMGSSSLARIALRYTSPVRDDIQAKLLNRLRSQLGAAKREYDDSIEALARYRVDPEDTKSGSEVGVFLCFIKGDWETGLELIAAGAEGELAEVARKDLRGGGRALEQVAIGDAWWDLSRRGAGSYRQGAEDRAVYWYRQAVDALPDSLDRLHVQSRLQEAGESDGRSPVAICTQLADEMGIDLTVSLMEIAVNSGRSGASAASR